LSCAGLLVTPGVQPDAPGRIWAIDATGAHAVRALCIGGSHLSDQINRKLVKLDLAEMDTKEALERLVKLLAHETQELSSKEESSGKPFLKEGTRLEAAIVKSNGCKLVPKLI
jgi:hypothetical protein